MDESDSDISSDEPPEVTAELAEQADDLCTIHDHISRVVADLEFPEDAFTDRYAGAYPRQFRFYPMLRTLLYQYTCDFSQHETRRRLKNWAYLQIRFGLERAPTQAALSYAERHRLSREERHTLKRAAREIREVASDHDLLDTADEAPSVEPNEKQGLTEEEILRAVRIARDRAFTEFATDRAPNAKYDDAVFWELQSYLSMTVHGKRETKRRAERLSWRSELPHTDTHTRAIKKLAAPNPQTELSEFEDPEGPVNWKRVRKILLDPFQKAIENLVKETDFKDHLREPVNVAIDVTPWRFWPSPWVDKDLGVAKEDFPTMVNGYKSDDDDGKPIRAYKFATLTVIGKDTPIILGIEPVREVSEWESDDCSEVSMTKVEVVESLLSQAEQYVDINKVMADREFDAHAVRDVIDRKGMTYLIPKRKQAQQDLDNIEDIKEHPSADIGVVNDVPLTVDDRTHGVDFMYVPSNEETGSYAIFTTNADVPPERVEGLTAQYRDRWRIENQYKVIKEHFLPRTTSKDYRVRMFYIVAAVLMYNVWRLTNLLLRTWYEDVHLGEQPPVPAGEVTEIIGLCIGPGTGYG